MPLFPETYVLFGGTYVLFRYKYLIISPLHFLLFLPKYTRGTTIGIRKATGKIGVALKSRLVGDL